MANKVMPVAIAYIFPGDSPMTIILIAILKKTDLGVGWRRTAEVDSSLKTNNIEG